MQVGDLLLTGRERSRLSSPIDRAFTEQRWLKAGSAKGHPLPGGGLDLSTPSQPRSSPPDHAQVQPGCKSLA